MYYRVQFIDSTGKPIEENDVLLEEVSVKRIARSEAIQMFNSNCIAWVNKDPEDY